MIGVVLGIGGGDGDDFVIDGAGIDHGHQTDGAGVHDGERGDGNLTKHQNVERIVILGERLRDEAIVCGIVHRGVKYAIHFDDAAGFVEFVFDAGAQRDFDDGLKFVRDVFAGAEVMPGMHPNSSENNCSEVAAEGAGEFIAVGCPLRRKNETLRLRLVRYTALRVYLGLQRVVESGATAGFC